MVRALSPGNEVAIRPLDTFHEIETPEGVAFRLHVAGPVVRSLAWSIDTLIRFGIYLVLGIVLSVLGKPGIGLLMILLFVVEWFYPVLFEIYFHGATPGKRSMGLCVVYDNGAPVGWPGSLLRNLLRFVDFLPLLYGFGLLTMCLNQDYKRLGDLAAGTRVVYRNRTGLAKAVPEAKAIPPSVPLLLDEQRAIVDYAGRLQQISQERAHELASIIAPQIARPGGQAVDALISLANWLLGR